MSESKIETIDKYNPHRSVHLHTLGVDVHAYMYSVISYRSQRQSQRNEQDGKQRQEESIGERCA